VADFQFNAEPKKRGRRTALIAVGALAVVGLGWLVWTDWTALDETRVKIGETRLKLDKANADLAKTASVEDSVLVLRETVKEYVKILPDDKEINSFVEQLTQFAAQSGVRVTKLDDADAKARGARGKKGPVAAFDKVVYRLSFDGFAEQTLRFMDLFENHERFVRIASLKIEAERESSTADDSGSSKGPEAPPPAKPHHVDVELETYVYDPKSKAQNPVDVPGEAQKVDRLRESGAFGADAQQGLALAKYVRPPRENRRDVLLDPRSPAGAAKRGSDSDRKAQEAAFAGLKKLLDVAVVAAAEEEKLGKQGSVVKRLKAVEATDQALIDFAKAVKEADDKRTITLDDLRKRFAEELDPEFKRIAKGREPPSQRAAFGPAQAQEALVRVRAAFESRRFDEVAALSDDLLKRRTGRENGDVAAVFAEVESLAAAAAAEIDFDGRAFTFGGTVVYKQDVGRSVAIINGRPYMPGDRLDEETSVAAITAAEITFEFRGRKVVRAVKASSAASADKKGAKPDAKKKKV
jgi:Tfp pilus assembly protein PilO